ncbi:MAG: tetratricopeptide repeat protein [Candidatus Omnitrophica bacterium]|nr:tetratricopeptide repeat protein [Candidatus Omnitrophota bacterium]
MNGFSRVRKSAIPGTCLWAILFFSASVARAGLIEETQVAPQPDGYRVDIHFLLSIRYQSHTPTGKGKVFRVQLRATNYKSLTDEEVALLRDRVSLSWDQAIGIPVGEITYEGGDPERPEMTFIFTEDVDIEFQGSGDSRTLSAIVKTAVKPPSMPEEVPFAGEIPSGEGDSGLMREASVSMALGEYTRAIQIYTKILRTAEGDTKKKAQEFLGLARERNGQLAHAKAEYEKYLAEFPEGADAERVRQRLAGLVTAAKAPKEPLKEAKRAERAPSRASKWDKQMYGNFSQFYFRDQTVPEAGETQVNRDDLTSDLDLNSRWRNEKLDLRGKFTTSYQNNFVTGEQDEDSISALFFEGKIKKYGLLGRFGRQSRTTGGVLGRFDGAHLALDIAPKLTFNTVCGFPVDSSQNTYVEYARRFCGVSADLGTFREHWDLSTFFIDQGNKGLVDRRAIGTELRYFDDVKGFFNLFDYDVFYERLNIFLFNGHWKALSATDINFVLDYRKSPLLTTNNAIQGQGVNKIAQLFDNFSDDELYALAEDRTAVSKSMTVGVTQDVKKDVQLTGEMTVSETEGTVASGGVDAVPGTGKEYSYSTQLITNNVLVENDVIITGLRYSDAQTNHTTSFTINARYPYLTKLRFIPKLRLDFREDKGSDDNRFLARPTMRIDYNFKKWMRFEVEGGFEWVDEVSSGVSQTSTEQFISAGYRLTF